MSNTPFIDLSDCTDTPPLKKPYNKVSSVKVHISQWAKISHSLANGKLDAVFFNDDTGVGIAFERIGNFMNLCLVTKQVLDKDSKTQYVSLNEYSNNKKKAKADDVKLIDDYSDTMGEQEMM